MPYGSIQNDRQKLPTRNGQEDENTSEGITLQIEKKAESAGNLNAYIYLIMDAQLNIQNGAYVSMDKKSIVNDLYHASLMSVFAVGYSMLGKKILKMAPPSIQKFDLEDTGKLVVIVAASEMTREYLIKQKILPEQINV